MSERSIEIIPVGDVSRDIIDFVVGAVAARFKVAVRLGEGMPVPQEAYNPRRGQYDASRILEKLQAHGSPDALKVLGVTEEDLYSAQLNFVFGQAKLGGCCGVISLFRLHEGIDTAGGGLFFERIEKEAVHELGHTLGLVHCRNPRCVMFYSNSLADTDRKSAEFCAECGVPTLAR